jgi:hypothetical protein
MNSVIRRELTYEQDPTRGWEAQGTELLLVPDRGKDGQLQLLPVQYKQLIREIQDVRLLPNSTALYF